MVSLLEEARDWAGNFPIDRKRNGDGTKTDDRNKTPKYVPPPLDLSLNTDNKTDDDRLKALAIIATSPLFSAEQYLKSDKHECELTQEETSAAYTLSQMSNHFNHSPISTSPLSPDKHLSCSIDKTDRNVKAKRPMNAFMLFAKKFRPEFVSRSPGKDNRAISKLLGDRWKNMKDEEKEIYSEEARLKAELQKQVYPDCWKRKKMS
ncbi:HMG box-containing protein 1 [Nymphon striatum]|nr:HMG box-containing protein 1 [Nymphon striatum]